MTGTISETRQEFLKVIWEIDNFLSLPGSAGSCINSPDFEFSDYWCHLGVHPYGKKGFEDSVGLYLFCDEDDTSSSSSTVIFTLAVKKADGTFFSKSPLTIRFNKIPSLGYINILARSDLKAKKDKFLPRDALTFSCILREVPPFEAIDVLSENLKKLFMSSAHGDVTFKLQSKKYRAHRAILAAQSNVFASALEHDTLERESGVIQIDDCDPDSFKEFLQYLYTGCADINESNVFHLFKAADKYLVGELKAICVAYLVQNMSVDNVCDAVALADDHRMEDLTLHCQELFCDNAINILGTPKWISLMKEHGVAADQLLQHFATKGLKLEKKK